MRMSPCRPFKQIVQHVLFAGPQQIQLRKKKIQQLCISRKKLGLRSTYTNLCGSWTRVTVIFRLPRLSVDSRPIYRPRPPLVNMIQVLHLLSKHSLLLRLYIKCYFLKLLCHCLQDVLVLLYCISLHPSLTGHLTSSTNRITGFLSGAGLLKRLSSMLEACSGVAFCPVSN